GSRAESKVQMSPSITSISVMCLRRSESLNHSTLLCLNSHLYSCFFPRSFCSNNMSSGVKPENVSIQTYFLEIPVSIIYSYKNVVVSPYAQPISIIAPLTFDVRSRQSARKQSCRGKYRNW